MQIYIPTKILSSLIMVLSLCFLMMMAWFILQPTVMSVVLAMEGNIGSEGNNAITFIKLAINYWGVIAIVLILLTYGIMQAQKREWRGETI